MVHLVWFPGSCSIIYSHLLAILDFCEQLCSSPWQGPEMGGMRLAGNSPTTQGIHWTLRVLMATGAQHRVRRVLSLHCPAPGHKGLPPASFMAGATACCVAGSFACCSYSVHPHIHAFNISSCFSKCKTPETTCQFPSHLGASDGLFILDRQMWISWSSMLQGLLLL